MGQALQSCVSFANKEDSFDKTNFQKILSPCLLISRDYRFSSIFFGQSPALDLWNKAALQASLSGSLF
jgi:hypothetical protein